MARPLRIEFAGALWHVTARGNERRDIVLDADDRRGWLEIFGQVVAWAGWRLHAYVLMTNHYHLLIETPEATLSRGMRELNGRYGQRFNRRHGRSGHLFQGRFRGILVEKAAHLLELCRYVVLNPVRAGLVERASEWAWSNYRATAGMAAAPEWLEVRWTLAEFGRPAEAARRRYREFVREGVAQTPWDGLVGQIYLGGEAFRECLAQRMGVRKDEREFPRAQRQPHRPTLDRLVGTVSRTLGVTPEAILRGRGGVARTLFAHLGREVCHARLREIGERLGVDLGRVSQLAAEGRRLASEDRRFRRWVGEIAEGCGESRI